MGITDDQRTITLEEFQTEVPKLVTGTTPEGLAKTFKTIDRNGGGKILFDEFCRYVVSAVEVMEEAIAAVGKPTGAVAIGGKETVKPIDELDGMSDQQKQNIKDCFNL